MSDPAGIAAAAVRAHMLLGEGQQPLIMTPGDLRKLLARYQRGLQELADAVEPITPIQDADWAAGRDAIEPHELRSRLMDLPRGHPSSPFNEDGSPRPPVPRLQDLDVLSSTEGEHRPGPGE
jgi:hypothetical protein